ncbi:MAG: monomeric [FeFe] hydrogenase [Alphaproteobacteria bacterium]
MEAHNYAAEFKREVLVRIIKAFMSGKLIEQADSIPVEMRPRGTDSVRCCIYKERAVARDRCLAAMGIRIEDTDDRVPLSTYARQAIERDKLESSFLTISDIACKGCGPARYFVTDLCQGCLARPCTTCPFGAISVVNGKSHIDTTKCKNCGICANACPYHAIIQLSVPCEAACPVGAISKDEKGVAVIDFSKCIACGRCMNACPFGTISEKSELIDVMKAIKSGKRVVAMLAPAIMGQFEAKVGQILSAVQKLGFSEVVEVAHGADVTTTNEAKELAERLQEGAPFMTTSCCPAYFSAVRKHIPELAEFVSHTKTPMHYTAELVKQKYPDAVTVFVGPCVAKLEEGLADELVDYVLTNTELQAFLEAMEIDVAAQPADEAHKASGQGRGYPLSGGVAAAVKSMNTCEVCPVSINGLNKEAIRQLKQYAKTRKADGNLIEVMACYGGCIGGAAVTMAQKKATKIVQKAMDDAPVQEPICPKQP